MSGAADAKVIRKPAVGIIEKRMMCRGWINEWELGDRCRGGRRISERILETKQGIRYDTLEPKASVCCYKSSVPAYRLGCSGQRMQLFLDLASHPVPLFPSDIRAAP